MSETETSGEGRARWSDPGLRVVFAVTLMAVLGVSSVTPAFPRIVRAFDLSAETVGLLITVYTLPGIFLRPLLGAMADRVGRRAILVPSLFLFGLAGGACALAPDFRALLALRLVQGIGAAALGSLNVTLIGDMYAGRERTRALGYNSAVLNIGTASYPALGGGLALLGWNYPFLLPLLAVPVGVFALLELEVPEPEGESRLRSYVKEVWRLARKRRALLLFAVSFVTFLLLFGVLLAFLPILMEARFGSSTLVIGLVLSAASVASGLTATTLGRLAARFSEPTLVRASFALYAGALALIPLVTEPWLVALPVALYGVANGLNIPCVLSMVASLAPARHRAALISVNGTFLRAGQTLGPIVMAWAVRRWGPEGAFHGGAAVASLAFLLLVGLLVSRSGGEGRER